jgi:hypothetical protein
VAGGEAKLGEARVDIVADDRTLSAVLRRSERKVKDSAARMSRSATRGTANGIGEGVGGGGGGGGRGFRSSALRLGAFGAFGGVVGFSKELGEIISRAVGITESRGKQMILDNLEYEAEERKKVYEKNLQQINSEMDAQGRNSDYPGGRALNWFLRQLYGDPFKDRIDLDTEYKGTREALSQRKQILKAEIDTDKFNSAAQSLESAADSLTRGFEGNSITTNLASINDDIVRFISMTGRLYYPSGMAGVPSSFTSP